jgi:O-antigen/teichoic acid export membrane protein
VGIIRKQAFSNAINIIIGFLAGAINTIIILPRAFENNLDDWGLLKLVLSFALILAPVFGLGVNNIIIKEYDNTKDQNYKQSILGFSMLIALIGSILLSIFVQLKGLRLFTNNENAILVEQNIYFLLILSIALTVSQVYSGYIVAIHKTPFIQFINDTFLKGSYLLISIIYLFFPFDFELFFMLYVMTYVLTLFIYFFYAKLHGFKAKYEFKLLAIKELINYGFYTVLDRGAAIIVANLDLIMIAYLLELSDVAIYGLAFFIAAVVLIPQKAIMTPSYPLVSTALKTGRKDDLQRLYKQSSINQLIIGGVLFALIWSNINEIFMLIPSDFSSGKWVVFYIGLSRLFILSTGVSGPIIIFSTYYRINLFFNLFLILLTIITNYYLIKQFGMTGAAMATAITFFIYNILKTGYIKFRFNIQPFSMDTIKSVAILILVMAISYQIRIFETHAFFSIIVKSILISILLAIGFYGLNVKAEILDVPGKILKRFVN